MRTIIALGLIVLIAVTVISIVVTIWSSFLVAVTIWVIGMGVASILGILGWLYFGRRR